MADVVVVGGGVGGLCAAVRLQVAGHAVTLVERNEVVGGKLAERERDGFRFDVGPSLLTLPHLFDEVLRLAGSSLDDELDLVRLDPQFRYHWPGGATLDVHDDPARTAESFDAFAPGGGAAYRRFLGRAERIWEVSERTFFAGAMTGPVSLARRMRSPADLAAIDPGRKLARAAAATFDDARLVQWAGRYATYSGSSPFEAPATLGCIPWIEAHYGAWHPRGGLGTLRRALARAAQRAGVHVRTGTEVAKVETARGAVTGVVTLARERLRADVVVANVDASHLYADLLPRPREAARVRRAGRSSSGFVVLAAVRGRTEGIAHHNVWFSPDDRAEFDQRRRGEMAEHPTVYACVPAATDPSMAPEGHESWFLLVNTPPGARLDAPVEAARVLDRLGAHGVDLRPRLLFTETITPADLARRTRSPGGAIYGTSSNGRRAAFLRPANRGPVRGLYLVGGSSHPGGGLPLVALSARIVAGLVAEDAG